NMTFDGTSLTAAGLIGPLKVSSTTGVNLTATDGVLTLAGLKATSNNENLTIDFETSADTVAIASGTGVTTLDFGSLALTTTGAGTFGAGATVGVDAATNTAGVMKFWSAGANNWSTTFTAGTQTADATYTLPTAMPASNKILQSDSSGVLSWVADADSATSPAGANYQIQYYEDGAFGASANFDIQFFDTTKIALDMNDMRILTSVGSTGTENLLLGQSGNLTMSGTKNILAGYQAGLDLTTGYGNQFIGYQAGTNITTGSNDVFLGEQAGFTNITGNANVFLGYQAGYYETGSSKLFIDNQQRASEADAITKALMYGVFDAATANQILTINAATINLPFLPVGTGDAGAVTADTSTGKLYVASSSLKYKHNVQPLEDDWSLILQAQPKSFEYKGSNQFDVGYIAEDFDALGLNDLVLYNKAGEPNAIKYDRIPLYMLEIIKQQQQDVDTLKLIAGINAEGTYGTGALNSSNATNSITQLLQNLLTNTGITIQNGLVSIKNLAVNTFAVKTARINQIEMVDSVTGEIYCTWIENGEWKRMKGDCSAIGEVSVTSNKPASKTPAGPEETISEQTKQIVDKATEVVEKAKQTSKDVKKATEETQQAVQQVQQVAETAADEAAQETAKQIKEDAKQEKESRKALESAIKDAQSKLESDYTPETWSALQTVLTVALTLSSDESASASDMDGAKNSLDSAISELAKPEKEQKENKNENKNEEPESPLPPPEEQEQPTEAQPTEEPAQNQPGADNEADEEPVVQEAPIVDVAPVVDIIEEAASGLLNGVMRIIQNLFNFTVQRISASGIGNKISDGFTTKTPSIMKAQTASVLEPLQEFWSELWR
ncbi:MAG: tail fiber domain-containing protein, partial [Candidatus Staskawiczbacteria bacterium]|nr:tail fiber domain-containing protein [Candidatus Staskawiczbacteria bacterium]